MNDTLHLNISGSGNRSQIDDTLEEVNGANFGDKTKLESHFNKHGKEFKGIYGDC